jgi:ABC-type transport system involved in multi-copper enzyme maturation permease subunit
MFRHKMFWALDGLALMIFFFFFYGQYLVVWITLQTENQTAQFAGVSVRVGDLTKFLGGLHLSGTGHTFGNFIWFEGYIATIVLAFAGSVLVGNDFHHGSLPFYLSKPIARRHYVLGKCLAVGLFVNLLTTVPALVLFAQAGLLYDWKTYYLDNLHLLFGILAYGVVLTTTLSLLLVATAVAVRRTVPMVMVWSALFVLCRAVADFLATAQMMHPAWRLIDLWNDLYVCGMFFLGSDIDPKKYGAQPAAWQAFLVVGGVCAGSTAYLWNRVKAVEVVG